MRHFSALLLVGFLLTNDLSAQVSPLIADVDSVATRELIALEYHLSDRLNGGDWLAYSPFLAEDYRQTNRRGEVRTKQDVILGLQKRDRQSCERTVPDSVQARIYGDTGALTAVLTGTAADGGAAKFRSRVLKIFVRRNGRWYMVGMQGTPLPQASARLGSEWR